MPIRKKTIQNKNYFLLLLEVTKKIIQIIILCYWGKIKVYRMCVGIALYNTDGLSALNAYEIGEFFLIT